jgi:hypothetical protein
LKFIARVTQDIDDATITKSDSCSQAVINEKNVRIFFKNIFEMGKPLTELAIQIKLSYVVRVASIQDSSIVISSWQIATTILRLPKRIGVVVKVI